MNKKIWIAVVVTVVMALAIVITIQRVAQRPGTDKVLIGVLLPLSGPVAEPGTKALNGVRLAIDLYNQASGSRLRLIVEDSRSDPKSGVSAAQKLINVDGVKVIIGDLMSSVAMAVAPLAEENKVILFAPGASNPKFPDMGSYIFRNWASDDYDGRVMADYLAENSFRNGVVIYVNNEYGLGLAKAFQERFLVLGCTLGVFEGYDQGSTDFRPIVAKIKRIQSVQFIYLPGQPIENGHLVKQLHEGGVDVPLFANLSVESPEFAAIVGSQARGIIFTSPAYDPLTETSDTKTFMDLYEEAYDSPPDVVAGHGYDAGNILIAALQQCKFNLSQLRDSLAGISEFPGVTGKTTFLPNGDVKKDVFVKKLTGPSTSEMLARFSAQ